MNFNKVFCIGMNKTGTTSLLYEFVRMGISTGNQKLGEELLSKYISGERISLKNYCKSARFFQDIPFSIPNVYKYLDNEFPNSKFILSVRNSPEEWYDSLTKFHTKSKLIGIVNKLPTSDELKKSNYVHNGWAYMVHNFIYNVPYDNPYKKDVLIDTYKKHIDDVLDYFKDREDDLLVINLADDSSYERFKEFIGVKNKFTKFLHENKSK
jgi:hypothetical protein